MHLCSLLLKIWLQVKSTCKGPGLVSGHSSEVPQVTFVSHQHNDNVVVRMVTQLLQPALYVLIGQVLGNVIHQKSANCTPVIPERDNWKIS